MARDPEVDKKPVLPVGLDAESDRNPARMTIEPPSPREPFNNYGTYGDSLIICDLVEAGYLDAGLHAIPE